MNDRQVELARGFAALHAEGSPLILLNAWDELGSVAAVWISFKRVTVDSL